MSDNQPAKHAAGEGHGTTPSGKPHHKAGQAE
jgi:hypothetical protein